MQGIPPFRGVEPQYGLHPIPKEWEVVTSPLKSYSEHFYAEESTAMRLGISLRYCNKAQTQHVLLPVSVLECMAKFSHGVLIYLKNAGVLHLPSAWITESWIPALAAAVAVPI